LHKPLVFNIAVDATTMSYNRVIIYTIVFATVFVIVTKAFTEQQLYKHVRRDTRQQTVDMETFARRAKVDMTQQIQNYMYVPPLTDQALPSYYKFKERILLTPRDQGGCASCFSFSVCDMVSDRISIFTGGKVRVILSPQELLSCYVNQGCNTGGSPEIAFEFIIEHGIGLESNYPYSQTGRNLDIPACNVELTKSTPRYFGVSGTNVSICTDLSDFTVGTDAYNSALQQNILNMMRELITNGPFVAAIEIFDTSYLYDGKSVFTVAPEAKLIGGHSVEVVGYCQGANTEEPGFEGKNYWILKSSWSTGWADDGFFYVRMGSNECGIESRCSRILVDFSGLEEFEFKGDRKEICYYSFDEYRLDPLRDNYVFFANNVHIHA
jgi:hypothetical protein